MFAYWFQTAETLRDIISKAFWFCSVYIRSYSYFSSVSKVKFLIRDILESLGASGCRVIRPSVTKHRTFRNLDAFAKKLPSVWKLFQISERRKVSHFRSEKTSNVVFFKYHKKFKYKKQLIVGMRNHLQWLCPPFLQKVRSRSLRTVKRGRAGSVSDHLQEACPLKKWPWPFTLWPWAIMGTQTFEYSCARGIERFKTIFLCPSPIFHLPVTRPWFFSTRTLDFISIPYCGTMPKIRFKDE